MMVHPFGKGETMETDEQIDDSSIQDEQVARQEIIPFYGDDLAAAMTANGDIYITLAGLCEAMGLSPRPQLRRILRTPALAKGVRRIPIKTAGGTQRINCLRVDRVALWLVGIEPTRVKEQFRTKIEAYQDELAPVAMRVFMRVIGIASAPPASADPHLAALAEQYDVLMSAATFIAEHMDNLAAMPDQLAQAVKLLEALTTQQAATTAAVAQLSQEQKLAPAQKQHIKEAVERIVTDSAGKPGELKQGQIYGALYRRFHVSAYGEIAAARYEEVMAFLRDLWKRATAGATPEQQSLI